MKIDITHHHGASFCAGADLVHLLVECADAVTLERAWDKYLVASNIAGPLAIRAESVGLLSAHAECYAFLPARIIEQVVAQSSSQSENDAALLSELTDYSYDAGMISATYAMHRRLALQRGWPVWPLMLGRYASLLLGAGQLHSVVPANLSPTTSALLGIASQDKSIGRDLLAAYSLPVAPGGLAATPEIAVFHARRIGWPVVLKRLSGGNSDGVILNIRAEEECRDAARELIAGGSAILVEKKIKGIELRVHFVAGRIEQILIRIPQNPACDGASPLRQILEKARPGYLDMAVSSMYFRRQLVYRLWDLGVRTYEDIDRIIPPDGSLLQLGKEFHRFRDAQTEGRALHPSDRERIEEFLAACGKPSGALDLIVSKIGAPLSDGGAVLEVNVPSGMWYLDNREKVAERELDAWTSHIPGFSRSKGRVPFRIAAGTNAVQAMAESKFRSQFPEGRIFRFRDAGGWAPILTSASSQLLVLLSDEDVRHHGLPMNLSPVVWFGGARSQIRKEFPYLAKTLENAGPGVRFRRIDT
jgi:hypothetical protein